MVLEGHILHQEIAYSLHGSRQRTKTNPEILYLKNPYVKVKIPVAGIVFSVALGSVKLCFFHGPDVPRMLSFPTPRRLWGQGKSSKIVRPCQLAKKRTRTLLKE